MFCSKCGEADQNVNSYCRKCGSFLLNSLEKPVTFAALSNVFSSIIFLFLLLLWFISKYDAINTITLVCGLIICQFTNTFALVSLMTRMRRTSRNIHRTSEEMQTEFKNVETNDLLPPADFQSVVPSVVEETTRNLEKVGRI